MKENDVIWVSIEESDKYDLAIMVLLEINILKKKRVLHI